MLRPSPEDSQTNGRQSSNHISASWNMQTNQSLKNSRHTVTVIKLTTPVTVHLRRPCTSTNTDFTLFAITKCSKTHKSYIKTHLSTGSSRITLSPKCVIYKANKQLFASWSDQKHYKQHKTVSKSFIHVHLSQISIRTKTTTTDSKRKH